MATTANIYSNGYVTLKNTSDKKIAFIPYKENFASYVDAGATMAIPVKTVGQALYYLNQAKAGFEVANVETAPSAGANVYVIPAAATVTITNLEADKVMAFIPYRENFQVDVKPGDSYVFEIDNPGQFIYYANQDTGADGIDVKLVAKNN